MGSNLTKLIQAWFLEHDSDGEFLTGTRAYPYSVIGSGGAAGRVIFTTKPNVVSAVMHERDAPPNLGMVGRYGLPNKADLGWIRKVIGQQSLLFLGDMDPVDLMVFAWLRASLRPKHVTYLGVNDTFLKSLRFSSTKSISSPCTASEQEAIALLRKVLPDLRETVGQKHAEMLERGHKIELDVIVSKKRKVAAALPSLLSLTPSRKMEQKKRRTE